MVAEELMVIVLWLGLVPAITAVLAGIRGRNVVGWYILGVALPVLTAVAVMVLPRRSDAGTPVPTPVA